MSVTMMRAMLERVSLYPKNLSAFKKSQFSLSSTSSKLRLFSADNGSLIGNPKSLTGTATAESQVENDSMGVQEDYVSKEELEKRVKKYMDGDLDAIPSIFEGILHRKLAELKGEERPWDLEQEGSEGEQFASNDREHIVDEDIELTSNHENLHESDKVIDSLLNARDILMKTMEKKE